MRIPPQRWNDDNWRQPIPRTPIHSDDENWRLPPQNRQNNPGVNRGLISPFMPGQLGLLSSQLNQGFRGGLQNWRQNLGQMYQPMPMMQPFQYGRPVNLDVRMAGMDGGKDRDKDKKKQGLGYRGFTTR